jgi:hypothetical protein
MLYYRRRTGERFLGKQVRFRKGSWIILPLAILAWFVPISTAQATNLLDNGTFDGSSGWTISQNGGSGVLFNGALRFSYETGEVSQTVSVSPGATLNVSFTVDNSQANSIDQGITPDTWTATLSSSPAASTVTRSVAHGPETFSLSITVPQGATTATLTFSGMDNGFWAGHYGPIVTDATLSSTPAPLPYAPRNNGCGPYQAFSVTGSSGGTIWGSNPYTDDSNFSSAAVHAGLISVGQTAIIEPYLVDNYPSYQGSTANGVSTYDWGGSWCGYYIRVLGTEGITTTTTTTTLPKSLGAPTNLTVTNTDSGVLLNWDAANENSEISPERYAVSWSNGTSGWGIATGNVGDPNALNTQILISYQTFASTGGLNAEYTFTVRADNDTDGVYSQVSDSVTLTVGTPEAPTTTTPEETTTTWPEQMTTTTTIPSEDVPTTDAPVDSTVPTQTTTDAPAPATETTDAPDEEDTSPETTVAEPETTDPETTSDTEPEPEPEQPTGDVTTEDLTDLSSEELADELESLSTEELTTLVESIDEPDQLEALIDAGAVDQLDTDQLLSIIDNPVFTELSAEAFAEVLTTVLDEPLTDEQFDSVIDAVLGAPISDEQFDALVDALGSDAVSVEQVQGAVDAIIENGLTEEFATSLATSAEILTSIDGDAAAEIFAEVPVSDLTDEEATQIVEAVQDAPEEVRESFETEINIFDAGSFDIYVPVGSAVDVETRRVVIAATTVVSILTVASPPAAPATPSGGSGGGGGPSGPTGSESSSTDKRRRLPGGR